MKLLLHLCCVVVLLLGIPSIASGGDNDGPIPPAELSKMHEQMLYPVVLVRTTSNSGGSGTVIYSEDRGDGHQTFVLTNHHVVDSAIRISAEWSSLLQQDVKKERNEAVGVELFRYDAGSRQDVVDAYRAEIVAHSKQHDLALVKLKTSRKIDYVATFLAQDAEPEIFEPIWAIGCSLLHPPVVTTGTLNYLDDVIDRKVYWMGSAQIIFGNSGGAVFLRRGDEYFFIGVPSRVASVYGQAITHMGWFVPITRIREWIEDEHLAFLVDPKSTPKKCFELREELQRKAELQQLRSMRRSGEPTLAPPNPNP